eukprot:jgi/Botrbrau1/3096/Bobra.0070s0081.1
MRQSFDGCREVTESSHRPILQKNLLSGPRGGWPAALMGKTPEKDLDARNLVLDLQDAVKEKLLLAEKASDELHTMVPAPRHDPGEVAQRPENPVTGFLHEIDGLLTDFCEQLLDHLNESGASAKQSPDEELALRQHISAMARRFEDLGERQQEYVRVIKNLKRMHDDELALHKQEAVYWKREAMEARSVRERELQHMRELRARDLKEARQHALALEETHRLAKEDLVKLCTRGVASIADTALEVLVADQQLKIENPEMADIVYNALQTDINEKLEAWTQQYCAHERQRARSNAPPIRRASSAGLQSCLRKTSSLSTSSNSSFSSAGSGEASPPGGAALPRPTSMPRSLLSTAPISLHKPGSRSSSASSEILPASPVKARSLARSGSRSMLRARFEGTAGGSPPDGAMQAKSESATLPKVSSFGSRAMLRARSDGVATGA